jgi:hypothetical protein
MLDKLYYLVTTYFIIFIYYSEYNLYILYKHMIPKIIHFMWLDKNPNKQETIPEKYKKNVSTFLKHNPDFEVKFWFNSNTLAILQQYPDIYNFYKKVKIHISKCDIARLLVLYHCGGIYSDLDFYCEQNLSPLCQYPNFFCFEPKEHMEGHSWWAEGLVFNGFFGCEKNQKKILDLIYYIKYNFDLDNIINPVKTTGPEILYRYFKSIDFQGITFIDSCHVLPITYDGKVSKECVALASDDIYVRTLWKEGTNWWHDWAYLLIEKYLKLTIVLLLLILFTIIYFKIKK